jgi:3-oxoacyl-ACP reductase-like protein
VELSPRQRSAVFIAVVIALAALGYYLVVPAVTHSRGNGHAKAATTPSASVAATQAPATEPTTAPAVQASAAAAGGPDIYAWLPFTQQNLAAAASVATRFSVDYNTFTYTESATDYIGAMSDLVTGQLAGTLRAAFLTPGVVQLRKSQQQVSTGTATINALRAFGPSSMTFVVTAGQKLATTKGTSNGSTQYAVTVTGSGSNWQVSDIELESAGNQ